MRPEQIVLRPIVTEKAEVAKTTQNKYVFEVASRAGKLEIREAVERLFHVRVSKVTVANMAGKPKRMGAYEGLRPGWKKAWVTLKPGQKIEMLERV